MTDSVHYAPLHETSPMSSNDILSSHDVPFDYSIGEAVYAKLMGAIDGDTSGLETGASPGSISHC